MKKQYMLALRLLLTGNLMNACPVCVGRITTDSQPFFKEHNFVAPYKALRTTGQKTTHKNTRATRNSRRES